MALTHEQQREVQRRADRMSALVDTVGWIELEAEAGRKIVKLRRVAAALALDPQGADQRKLDTIRGTIAAINWFVGVPHSAQATLAAFLREQGIEIEEEEDEWDGTGVHQRA